MFQVVKPCSKTIFPSSFSASPLNQFLFLSIVFSSLIPYSPPTYLCLPRHFYSYLSSRAISIPHATPFLQSGLFTRARLLSRSRVDGRRTAPAGAIVAAQITVARRRLGQNLPRTESHATYQRHYSRVPILFVARSPLPAFSSSRCSVKMESCGHSAEFQSMKREFLLCLLVVSNGCREI